MLFCFINQFINLSNKAQLQTILKQIITMNYKILFNMTGQVSTIGCLYNLDLYLYTLTYLPFHRQSAIYMPWPLNLDLFTFSYLETWQPVKHGIFPLHMASFHILLWPIGAWHFATSSVTTIFRITNRTVNFLDFLLFKVALAYIAKSIPHLVP